VFREKGSLFSVLVSHLDTGFRHALEATGGIPSKHAVPVYLFSNETASEITEPGNLSFLDSDYPYLF
jgi:hypothetical protein